MAALIAMQSYGCQMEDQACAPVTPDPPDHEFGSSNHMRPACFILPARSPASSPSPQK